MELEENRIGLIENQIGLLKSELCKESKKNTTLFLVGLSIGLLSNFSFCSLSHWGIKYGEKVFKGTVS